MRITALGFAFVIVAVIAAILLLRHFAPECKPANPPKE
jgi:hypothetical protein